MHFDKQWGLDFVPEQHFRCFCATVACRHMRATLSKVLNTSHSWQRRLSSLNSANENSPFTGADESTIRAPSNCLTTVTWQTGDVNADWGYKKQVRLNKYPPSPPPTNNNNNNTQPTRKTTFLRQSIRQEVEVKEKKKSFVEELQLVFLQ